MQAIDNKILNINADSYYKDNLARQRCFSISESTLQEILDFTGDTRTTSEFVDTYNPMEAEVVYEYASNINSIISEDTTYSDDFEEKYNDYIRKLYRKALNPQDIKIPDKDLFYICGYF